MTPPNVPAEITRLQTTTSNTIGVMDSAIVFINGVAQLVRDAVTAALAANPGVNLSALTAVADALDAKDTALASAIAAPHK